jgi:hypothetical protein
LVWVASIAEKTKSSEHRSLTLRERRGCETGMRPSSDSWRVLGAFGAARAGTTRRFVRSKNQNNPAATSVSLSRVSQTPPALRGRGLLWATVTSMRMPDECERVEQWPSFADAFREIHRFILTAMDGNASAANALFRKYLNGELPDELLSISRSWVQEEQGPSIRPAGETVGISEPQASERLTPVGPVEGRRLRRARNRRRRASHLLSRRGRTSGPSLDVGERA